ncbi:MAG TPA: ATP-binding cassette domain-containing protein, partial [Acidisoma sp.]|uniref:ATP-binding cassette domain-containing protein n=1 Tax=Acidisoma sp. TaxID=1872115 RepID=UPI002C3E80B0
MWRRGGGAEDLRPYDRTRKSPRAAGRETIETIYKLFPRLEERRTSKGGKLSGGEQEMLAIGRALLLNPRFLIL